LIVLTDDTGWALRGLNIADREALLAARVEVALNAIDTLNTAPRAVAGVALTAGLTCVERRVDAGV
jgi:hypothetical protein